MLSEKPPRAPHPTPPCAPHPSFSLRAHPTQPHQVALLGVCVEAEPLLMIIECVSSTGSTSGSTSSSTGSTSSSAGSTAHKYAEAAPLLMAVAYAASRADWG